MVTFHCGFYVGKAKRTALTILLPRQLHGRSELVNLYLNYCGRKISPGLSHQPVPTVSAKRHRISLYVTGQLVMPCGAISAHGYTARAASTLLKSIDRWDIAMAPSRKRQPV